MSGCGVKVAATDLKSAGCTTVRVRIPPPARRVAESLVFILIKIIKAKLTPTFTNKEQTPSPKWY